jgi:hypothetical protein
MSLSQNRFRCEAVAAMAGSRLGNDRIVFQTTFGDIEMALYPDVGVCMLSLCGGTQQTLSLVSFTFAGSTCHIRPHTQTSEAWRIQQ